MSAPKLPPSCISVNFLSMKFVKFNFKIADVKNAYITITLSILMENVWNFDQLMYWSNWNQAFLKIIRAPRSRIKMSPKKTMFLNLLSKFLAQARKQLQTVKILGFVFEMAFFRLSHIFRLRDPSRSSKYISLALCAYFWVTRKWDM